MNRIAATSVVGPALVVDGDLDSTQIAGLCTAVAEAGLAITDIDMHSQSLADVFFELTGRPLR